MHVVLFEVWPREGKSENYFAMAMALKSELETVDGFVSVERFESVTEPGKFLSMSYWRDESSIQDWYTRAHHQDAQANGRESVFKDYRIRVAHVIRDYDMLQGRPPLQS